MPVVKCAFNSSFMLHKHYIHMQLCNVSGYLYRLARSCFVYPILSYSFGHFFIIVYVVVCFVCSCL